MIANKRIKDAWNKTWGLYQLEAPAKHDGDEEVLADIKDIINVLRDVLIEQGANPAELPTGE